MGATYTRQSSYTDGDVVQAADTNDEFDQLLAAFAASTGHTHDNTTGEGGPITKLLGTSITIGDATAGTDITVTFDGQSNDGVLIWMEDEDYFRFSDDILIDTTEKIQFRDTAIYINSSADGQLDLVADTEIQIAATTIDINGAADISGNLAVGGNLTVAGNATVTGTTTFNGGTLTLGDSASDNVVFGADVDSNIIPDDDDTYDLGSASQEWRNIFIDGTAHIDTLDIDENATVAGTLGVTGAITGSSTIVGTTISASTAFVPTIADGATLGTVSLEFGDLYLGDSGVIYLGADQDVTLTHIPDTGVRVNSTNKIEFNDASQFIHGSSATVLSLGATDEIDLTATAIDVNGTVDMSSTLAVTGNVTMSADATVGDDLTLISDAAVLGFGANTDVTLTHVHDTGLLLNSTMALQFNDASQFINAPSATVLDITATDEIELNATAIDVNGTMDVSGTLGVTGIATFADDIIIGDGKTIGSASDVDAITIASNGQVTLTQTLIGTALDISGDIDVDGTTNLDIVDIDGAVDMATTLAVAGNVDFNGDLDVDGTTNLDVVDIDGAVDMASTLTVAGNSVLASADVTGVATAATFEPDGDTAAGDNAAIGYTSVDGLIITGQGSTNDVTIKNDADAIVMRVPTGTDDVVFTDNVTISGDLTVTGTTTQVDTVTMEAANAVVFEGATADAHETTLTVVDPTADRTINLPNVSGTLPVLAAVSTTQVSSTPEELNILDGATVVVGEINALDLGSTAVGTAIASKAVILDSNKDYTGLRNLTITGELDAATLDISGAIDVEGTANLDVVDIDGAVDMATTLTLAGNADFNGDLDVDGTTNLDVVDIDGAVNMATTALVTGVLTTTAATVFNGGFASNADSTMGTDKKVQFRDAAIYVNSSTDGQLDIVADTEIQIAATTIDINGNVEVSGTTAQVGVSTSTAKDIFNASMSVKNGATSAGFVEFFEDSDNGNNKVTLIGPASTADVTLTLPAVAGTVATTDDATALAIALG